MNGQQDVLSAILISGILIAVVGSVYMWGVPLIEKNRDIATLQNAEDFMKTLNEKIKFVSNNGGKDQIDVTIPSRIEFSSSNGKIFMILDTQGTIYASEIESPLGKNDCTATQGLWGQDESSVFCVKSNKIDENKFRTTYSLGYLQLDVDGESFKIELVGQNQIGGQDHMIIVENIGTQKDGTLTKTLISVSIS